MWTVAAERLTAGVRWPLPTGSRWAGLGRRDRTDRRWMQAAVPEKQRRPGEKTRREGKRALRKERL